MSAKVCPVATMRITGALNGATPDHSRAFAAH
jgi:hypothetical protein